MKFRLGELVHCTYGKSDFLAVYLRSEYHTTFVAQFDRGWRVENALLDVHPKEKNDVLACVTAFGFDTNNCGWAVETKDVKKLSKATLDKLLKLC